MNFEIVSDLYLAALCAAALAIWVGRELSVGLWAGRSARRDPRF